MRSIPFVIILLVLALIADGPLRPGSASIDSSQIPLGIDSLLILLPQNGQLYIGGSIVARTGLADYHGKRALSRVERMTTHDGILISIDSFMVGKKSLLPLYQRSQDREGIHILKLSGMTEPVFYSNSIDLVLESLPLKPGYKTQLALTDEKGDRNAGIEVMEKVAVKTADGEECNTLKVHVNIGEDSGTYWFSDPGRILVRYVPDAVNMIFARNRGCPASI